MTIQVDSREHAKAIKTILRQFDEAGIKHFISKLPVGDYASLDNPRLAIDRKQGLAELCCNVAQDHERFKAELLRAAEIGIKLIILVEHGAAIKALQDVPRWYNPRLKVSEYAISGKRLHGILTTIQTRYGIEILFCEKKNTGKRIIELLEGVMK